MRLVLPLAIAVLAACGQSGGGTVHLELEAGDIEFSTDELSAPPGAQVQLEFVNEDALPHNVAVYTEGGEAVFVGDTITGPDEITYRFRAPDEEGEYPFRCDVHPGEMTGTFEVG